MPMDVYVKYIQGRAVLSFKARREWELYFQCDHPDHKAPVLYDFAAFACVAIAHRFRTNVRLHAPVSATALTNCHELSEFSRMAWSRNRAFEVLCNDVAEAPPPSGVFKSLCISTGIDSTYALLVGQEKFNFSHGLVVHGADYRLGHEDGFNGLYARVKTICEKAGLEPIVVKTNLRDIKFNWGMHHIAQLAACMHFLGPDFSDVVFAADNTIAQDMKRFPWGNNYFIGTHVGGGATRAHYIGYEVNRYEKIKRIQRDKTYMKDVGVCFSDKELGWNCGVCPKCIMTRIALECENDPCPEIFRANSDIVAGLDAAKIGPDRVAARGVLLRSNELVPYVSDKAIKKALIRLRERALKASK